MVFRITDEVYGVDLQMFDTEVLAAYIVDATEPLLIETGYARGVDHLRDSLRQAGVPPNDLAHAVISHIHLDHSGGAAALVDDASELTVYLHESTTQHLLDPEGLVESTKRAMGEHYEEFGAPDPLPASNLERVGDGKTALTLGDRTVELVHTPGHAPDHLAVWDPESKVLFANEALGSYYPRADLWVPPATLPRFDVAAVRDSIERLREFDATRIALSHFGVLEDPAEALDTASERLDLFEERIPELYAERDSDLEATQRAVQSELVDLTPYDENIQSFETRFQTQGFLRYLGAL